MKKTPMEKIEKEIEKIEKLLERIKEIKYGHETTAKISKTA